MNPGQSREVVVGLDNGGTAINATVLDSGGRFLVDRLVEAPSRVAEGPGVAIEALAEAFAGVLGLTGIPPGWPASSGTSRSRWTGCWPRVSRRPCAIAGWPVMARASLP